MLEANNRIFLVIVLVAISYFGAAYISESRQDGFIQIDGQSYEVLSVRETEQMFGVVREGDVFKHVTKPSKFQIQVALNNQVKWIDVDQSSFAAATKKLRSVPR